MPGAWSTMVVQVHAGPLTALLKVLLVLALLIPPSVGPAWSPRRRVPLPICFVWWSAGFPRSWMPRHANL